MYHDLRVIVGCWSTLEHLGSGGGEGGGGETRQFAALSVWGW